MKLKRPFLLILSALSAFMLAGCSAEPTFRTEADEALFLAVSETGDLDAVRQSVADGACIDEIRCGRLVSVNAVELAIENGHDAAAKWLIENGADINYTSSIMRETLLMFTAGAGKPELVRLLLEKGADAAAKDRLRDTALEYACRAADDDSAQETAALLLQNGAKPNSRTLTAAAGTAGNYGTARLIYDALIDSGIEPKRTPAVAAAISGDGETLLRLLRLEEVPEGDKDDVLFFTAAFGSPKVLQQFTERQLSVRDKAGRSLLDIARRYENSRCAEYLELHAPSVTAGGFGCTCSCCGEQDAA